MKVYCGTDIIEVARIRKAITENKNFKTNIFTKDEVNDIEKINNETVIYQRYAGRFAAKEAIYKSLSKVLTKENFSPSFLDVEVLNDEEFKRRPYINVVNKTLDDILVKYKIKIDLSISHVRENAIAMAVANVEKE